MILCSDNRLNWGLRPMPLPSQNSRYWQARETELVLIATWFGRRANREPAQAETSGLMLSDLELRYEQLQR